MKARQSRTRLAQQLHSPRRERVVRTAREISFLEADVLEHRLRDRDVLGFAAVRGTGERQLIVTPMKRIESAGLQQPHRLKWLGARSPGADGGCVMRPGDEDVIRSDHGGVHAMP